MTRAEKVERAQALRADGKLLREIAEEMGVAIQTVFTWLDDPDLSKQRARRERYKGRCVDCGKPTDGSNGYAAPERCLSCRTARVSRLGREYVLNALREWGDEHGGIPPSAAQWQDPTRDPKWPTANTVLLHFGTWNAGIRAAGFEPRKSGHYGRLGEDPAIHRRAVAMYVSGMSSREIEERLGCSRGSVLQWVRDAGYAVRGNSEAARLAWGRAA
jgi:transposase